MAVVGFDDMPLASYFDPSLTTMRQDLVEIGRQAAQLLISAIKNPGAQRQHLRLPAEMIIRESTRIEVKVSDWSLQDMIPQRSGVDGSH
jgi:LacI family repressor for deo operon, udp, cdd, tsx, nupC, and nupG